MTDPLDLAAERFVSLTTYRRSGEGVATPVWTTSHDGALVVTTSGRAGKTKRIRRDPRVTLQPCDRHGQVAEGAPTAEGTAAVLSDPAETAGPLAALRAKYGLEWWAIQGFHLLARLRSRERSESVILRIAARE